LQIFAVNDWLLTLAANLYIGPCRINATTGQKILLRLWIFNVTDTKKAACAAL
jgi:hypothetical protein